METVFAQFYNAMVAIAAAEVFNPKPLATGAQVITTLTLHFIVVFQKFCLYSTVGTEIIFLGKIIQHQIQKPTELVQWILRLVNTEVDGSISMLYKFVVKSFFLMNNMFGLFNIICL